MSYCVILFTVLPLADAGHVSVTEREPERSETRGTHARRPKACIADRKFSGRLT